MLNHGMHAGAYLQHRPLLSNEFSLAQGIICPYMDGPLLQLNSADKIIIEVN